MTEARKPRKNFKGMSHKGSAADCKSAAVRHGGSSPSVPTIFAGKLKGSASPKAIRRRFLVQPQTLLNGRALPIRPFRANFCPAGRNRVRRLKCRTPPLVPAGKR